ncbi:MAG TPA: MEDS domain-containing protein [Phycisphaerales bacterium]|nr:MEDS domain-containing protein [Phycisphaerales bacterium]
MGDPQEQPARKRPPVHWGKIAPCEHIVQVYRSDDFFLDALEAYAAEGLTCGEGVITIATPDHRRALAHRLAGRGINLDTARAEERYIELDADETLAQFMTDGLPDEQRFRAVVLDLLARGAEGPGGARRVRAFGEMVALLWMRGESAAALRLEELWHTICHGEQLTLFCAYPRSVFTADAEAAILRVCAAHSRIIGG